MGQKNKVRFNLKNVYYAKLTVGEDGAVSYGTPVHIPGAVSLSLSAEGEATPFYADGTPYYMSVSNNGYSGDLEMALIPDTFRKDILGEAVDTAAQVYMENANTEPVQFAFMWQFDGDKHGTRHVMYNCTASRPSMEGSTTNESKEPQTETLSLTATPLENGLVKAKTGADTPAEVYNGWFAKVWMPDPAAKSARLSALSLGNVSLSPAFDPEVTVYTAETTNATNTITATAEDTAATVSIKNGNTAVTNGAAATWTAGENIVTVSVSNGDEKKVYVVTVTKSAE